MKGTQRETVKVTWVSALGERCAIQKERRFVPGTPKRVVNAWKESVRAKLRKRLMAHTASSPRDRLAADALRYYPLIRHMCKWMTRRAEVSAWLEAGLADKHRHTISREDVLRIRGQWIVSGKVAPKTINNRVTALRDLYKKLDGDDAPTPCDGVKPLHVPKQPITVIDPAIVNRVMATLWERAEATGKRGHPAVYALQDRARLMVLASTGKRPCEVERAVPADVDLDRRVWIVRDAKHGSSEGMYLNDEMLAAWQEFARVDAWGKIPDHFPRRLRDAGWPDGVKPYNLRHSTWITASERGADLSDIQAGAGHKNIRTTRQHYVPVLNSRMQRLSESLNGRFGWAAGLADTEKPA